MEPAPDGLHAELSQGALAAAAFTKATGVAMTPLLGMTVLGAGKYFMTEPSRRASLPFHQRPWFFGAGLALVCFMFFGHRVPFIKRGFKVFKTWENKVSAVVALPFVSVPLAKALAAPSTIAVSEVVRWVAPVAWAAPPGLHEGSGFVAQAGVVVAWAVSLFLSATVWLATHSVNVLVLLSPFDPVDWVLKGARNAMIGLLVGAAQLGPWAGLAVSVVYVLIALVVAGWSFRLMVFGAVFTTDLMFFRSRRERVAPGTLRGFSASGLPGVPARSWGTLKTGDGLIFSYRPWLVWPRREVRLDELGTLSLERGLLNPVLVTTDPSTREVSALVRFPPRYRPHAEQLASELGDVAVVDPPVLRGLKAARAWLAEQFRRRRGARAASPV